LAAFVVAASSAVAKTHAHAKTLTGVVTSVNAKRHTLRLRVSRTAARAARAASAAHGRVVTLSFGEADVAGPNGAVVVGDHVTVTMAASSGHGATVAAAIAVIGQPNGGDAGQGAAIPGTVTVVDSADGSLTIETGGGELDVSVTDSTVIAVAGSNDASSVALSDISAGDHVIVFTDDASADPVVAIGILDSDPSSTITPPPSHVSFGGIVEGLDAPDSTVSVLILNGSLAGQTKDVAITDSTKFENVDGDTDASFSIADINVGDLVSVGTSTLDSNPIAATIFCDAGSATSVLTGTGSGDGSGGGSGDSGSGSDDGSTGSTGSDTPLRFAATVTVVGSDGLTVVPTNGPLSGQTVRVRVTSQTSFELLDVPTDVSQLQNDVSVGDTVEVYTLSESATPLTAIGLIDYGDVSSPE
jgi:hypothetical protein